MKIRRTERAQQMLDAVGAMLRAREIENSVLLAVLSRLASSNERASLLAWVEDEGAPLAAIARTGRPTALLSTGPCSAMEALADDLVATHRPLGGVHGTIADVDAFSLRWCARTGERPRVELETTVYVATSVSAPPDPGGGPRPASSQDLERLVPWFEAFAEEAGVPTDGSAAEMARRHFANETLWVWSHEDVACMAIETDATPSTSRIAWVYTPKGLRKRGYGSALVASLTARAFARGKRAVTLNADVKNVTSNAIYARIGYAPKGSAKTIVFER